METVEICPVCRSTTSTVALTATDHTVSQEYFDIRKCDGCGFHFTSPRPEQNSIGKYYLSENYISHVAKATSLKDRIYHRVRRRAIRHKHKLISGYHSSGAVLDVGCGTGDFLAFLQEKGYSAAGVEVSPNARTLAEAKGLKVADKLNDIPAQAQFQVITLWHVLEHVPDPRHTLEQLYARCTEDALLVIAVPDHDSWDCKHYGVKWAAWDVPRHLSHFRRADMKRLLQETGFEPIATKHMWFDAPYVSMLSEQYRGAGPEGSLLKGALFGLWSNVVAWTFGRPTSSSLYLARRAKSSGRG